MSLFSTLAPFLTNAAETAEEIGIEAALQAYHDKDKEAWQATCNDVAVAVTRLKALDVKSGFVKSMIDGLGVAIQQSLDNNPA
jgi:hypothetical protein